MKILLISERKTPDFDAANDAFRKNGAETLALTPGAGFTRLFDVTDAKFPVTRPGGAFRAIREFEPDAAIAYTPFNALAIANDAGRKLGFPSVFVCEKPWSNTLTRFSRNSALRGRLCAAAEKNISKACEVWTYNRGSEADLRNLGYTGGFVRVPYGLDAPSPRPSPEDIRRAREKSGASPSALLLLCQTPLLFYEGFTALFNTLSDLRGRGLDFRLLMTGTGEDRGQIAKRAAALGLDGAVGFAEDDGALRAAADLNVILTPYGGLRSLFLASAAGLPTLCVPRYADFIDDPDTGFIAPLGDFAERIRDLSGDRELLKRVGERAQNASKLRVTPAEAANEQLKRAEMVTRLYAVAEEDEAFRRELARVR